MMERNEIYRIYGTDHREMTRLLLEKANLEGDILTRWEALRGETCPGGGVCREKELRGGEENRWEQDRRSQIRIGIKPNLVSPTPAEYGATTHPQVAAGIIEYLQERNFRNITILEGSWIGDRTSDAYEYCGYRQLCEQYGVEFLDTQKDGSHPVDCGGLSLRICDCVDRIDYLINVPVLKGHGQTKITCALKNMKGLIPNGEKRHFHTMGLHQPIAHLSLGIRQDFIVVDHICGDLELEDGGNPVETNCVMAARDPVLLDSWVCRLLGYDTEEVPYIGMAEALGSGSADLSRCRITVLRTDTDTFGALEPDPFEPSRCPDDTLLSISCAIEDADSCSACYASLAPAILQLKREGLWDRIREKLPGRIAIGQGFAGCTGPLGVGRCCRGFDVNVPGCPPEEEDVYRLLRSYLSEDGRD